MRRRLLPCCGLLILLPLACRDPVATTPAPQPPEADERLTLSTPRRDYLLGEPVALELSFRNLSKETIEVLSVFVEPGHYEATVWIARDGERFKQHCRSRTVWERQPRPYILLKPGQALTYNYRFVCEHWDGEFRLAFPKPGDYRVYIVYPISLARSVEPRKNDNFVSNAVQLRVKEPLGEDARVWQQLNDPSLLKLLQADDWRKQEDLIKMAHLLKAHPKSGYAQALRLALSKTAPGLRNSLSFQEASLLGEVLGIKDFAPIEQDPKDKRLDAKWQQPAGKTTMAHLLRSLSKASGVPLDAPAEFKAGEIDMDAEDTTVRAYMWTFRRDGAWERRGNGYFLVPFKPEKPPDKEKAREK